MQSNPVKDFIKTLLGLIVPLLYTLFVGKFPDFPLDVANFVQLVLWFVGLLIGGWQSAFYYLNHFSTKYKLTKYEN